MRRWLAALLLLLATCVAAAQGVLPVPELTGRVIDQTDTLDPVQAKGLDEKLANFEQGKGTQIVVLLVPTTQPEDIASYANRVANAWKIGRKQVGDGIVIVVAKNDRKVRIEVAKTLEGAVPDLAAKQIIDDAITPKFRAGDFAGGLQAGVDQLIARINGEPLPAPKPQAQAQAHRTNGGGGFDFFDIAIFLFVAAPIVGMVLRGVLGRPLGSLATGGAVGFLAMLFTQSMIVAVIAGVVGLVLSLFSGFGPFGGRRGGFGAPVFFPGGGWGDGRGGGGGFGGGGGGFSSGGGGDFGGGGASGSW